MTAKKPSIKQLEYFVTIARSSNFRKAAAKLGISQPTLTNQVVAMEEALGVQLFERSRAGTLLSPEGRELLPVARDILDRYQHLMDTAQSSNRDMGGTNSFGMGGHGGGMFIPGCGLVLGHIAHVKHRLGRQQLELRKPLFLRLGQTGGAPCRHAVGKLLQKFFHQRQHGFGVFVLAAGFFGQIGHPLFQRVQIRQHQFRINGIRVTDGINPAIDMGDVLVIKTAQNMGNSIDFSDIA